MFIFYSSNSKKKIYFCHVFSSFVWSALALFFLLCSLWLILWSAIGSLRSPISVSTSTASLSLSVSTLSCMLATIASPSSFSSCSNSDCPNSLVRVLSVRYIHRWYKYTKNINYIQRKREWEEWVGEWIRGISGGEWVEWVAKGAKEGQYLHHLLDKRCDA